MKKPANFDSTQVGGDFTPVALGGHYAIIKNVSERTDKNGDPMIVVSIDFDKKDSQPGYFTEMFKNDTRDDKKYPNQAVNYITTERNNDCTRNFKSFMKAFADSNGIKEDALKWDDGFVTQFKNKKIGVVYGNVEEEYNGETKLRRKIRWFCNYAKVGEQRVPDDKLLNNKPTSSSNNTGNKDDFMTVEDGVDDFIPFE